MKLCTCNQHLGMHEICNDVLASDSCPRQEVGTLGHRGQNGRFFFFFLTLTSLETAMGHEQCTRFAFFIFVPRHEVGELRNAAVRLSFRPSHTCEHDISKTIALTNFSFGILVRYRDM